MADDKVRDVMADRAEERTEGLPPRYRVLWYSNPDLKDRQERLHVEYSEAVEQVNRLWERGIPCVLERI